MTSGTLLVVILDLLNNSKNMKYSYNWLKELTGTTKGVEELSTMVGLKGFELEEKESLGERFKNFVVGEILEIEKHPDADKLQLVKVDIGSVSEIVCGAWNIKIGDKVPVALVGSVLPQNKLKIEKREVRGAISNGMLCAEDELGLGKNHDGILILSEDAKIGQPLCEALGLDDTVVEFDILPDRAHDCLSYEGMAREICAMDGKMFETKNFNAENKKEEGSELNIEIEDPEGCPRYIGAVLSNIKIGPSPQWMQSRLVASGMEPINNIVDITNYVMLEVGSPLHAFDYSGVDNDGVSIVVRRAKKGEKLELLDETKLELDSDDLVIANKEKALALAGIKGGKYSGISDETNKVVLEAANFNGFVIRKSRQRHSLLTEAQARFEKGLSPRLAERGLLRAVELLKEHAGAELLEVVDQNKSKEETQVVEFDFSSIKKLLGYEIDKNEAFSILANLGFEIEGEGDSVKVSVPYWRLDIEGPNDLIEEVGRIVGYERITEEAICTPISIPNKNSRRNFEWKMREFMIGAGFDEVRNYSFYSQEDVEYCGIAGDHFELEKPLSKELSLMRQSLVPGLLRNIAHNQKFFDEVGLFEIGRTFLKNKEGKPEERTRIVSAMSSKSLNDERVFFNLKGSVESFFAEKHKLNIFFQEISELEDDIFHAKRSAHILIECGDGIEGCPSVGRIGEINPAIAKKYGIKERVVVLDLDFETLFKFSGKESEYTALRKYPLVLRDVSMYVPLKTKVQDVFTAIEDAGAGALVKLDLFDVYVDKEKERKSLAYHLSLGKDDGTLASEEVELIMKKVIERLEKDGIEVRKG